MRLNLGELVLRCGSGCRYSAGRPLEHGGPGRASLDGHDSEDQHLLADLLPQHETALAGAVDPRQPNWWVPRKTKHLGGAAFPTWIVPDRNDLGFHPLGQHLQPRILPNPAPFFVYGGLDPHRHVRQALALSPPQLLDAGARAPGGDILRYTG